MFTGWFLGQQEAASEVTLVLCVESNALYRNWEAAGSQTVGTVSVLYTFCWFFWGNYCKSFIDKLIWYLIAMLSFESMEHKVGSIVQYQSHHLGVC